MGNIYFEQGKLPQAIKHYRMALDQVPITHKEMRWDLRSIVFQTQFFVLVQ
jgi:intraflagellar transport protein 88